MPEKNRAATVAADRKMLCERLASLYAAQLQLGPNDYVRYHASPQAILSHVNSFLVYRSYLPARGRILDWGCQHAPDACLVKASVGHDELQLAGCDFLEPNRYPAFWDFAGLEFVSLTHRINLPFADEQFDGVIASGALEHAAMDYESLKELYRILKPDTHLIITHLPNRYSYTEFIARRVRGQEYHRRLYTIGSITTMLRHAGFVPMLIRRHHFLPTNRLKSLTRLLAGLETSLERTWPFSLFCADILVVASKVTIF